MGSYEEGSELMCQAIISLHRAGHSNIPGILKKLATEYKKTGLQSFLPPVDKTHTAQIIPFPNSPDEITS